MQNEQLQFLEEEFRAESMAQKSQGEEKEKESSNFDFSVNSKQKEPVKISPRLQEYRKLKKTEIMSGMSDKFKQLVQNEEISGMSTFRNSSVQ